MARYHQRGRHGRVVQTLGTSIVSGEIQPGHTLDLDDLESSFSVSRTVIREAVKVLAGKGLVDSRQRRGTYVRPRDEWNLLDPDVLQWRFEGSPEPELFGQLHEIRMMIEPDAARLAALRRTATDVEAAAAALSRMQRALDVAGDVAFHAALLAASHNDLVGSLAMIIEMGLNVRDRLVHEQTPPSERDLADHRRVLDAVVAREPDRARSRMEALLVEAGKSVPRQTSSVDEGRSAGDGQLPADG